MRTVILFCALSMAATLWPSQDMGVAYVVQTITLRGVTFRTDPGHRPQRVNSAAEVTAITRLEVPAGASIALSQGQLEELAFAIADTAELTGVRAVQIDFDATISQRCFYRALIHRVRELLPAATPLSMTALASWCTDDDWISDLPIEEAVPMLRMGRDWKAAAKRAREDGRAAEGPCRNALGLGAGK